MGRSADFPYINWIQFVSNNHAASSSPVAGNIYSYNYVENNAGPQPFVFTYAAHQLSNVILTQTTQGLNPMPVAVIFGFRLSDSY